MITAMNDETGRLTGDEQKIRKTFVNYFKNLYSPPAHTTQTNQQHDQTHDRTNYFQTMQQGEWKLIPESDHHHLTKLPDYHEIRKILFQMGPDKSPGPDGVTCRFLQENWPTIGPDLVAQIRHIFATTVVPENWLQCNVVLIPKNNEPLSPTDYRPISIGNVTYRLLMKVIANRLRPYIQKIISKEQTAFISGRCITESIVLVKEVLHSFNSAQFKEKAFMLKADIMKAFDKMEWVFLRDAMAALNMPDKLINLVLYSFNHAKVTIQVNGMGDGFIIPTRGLRQGCPMSPYCFIMVMEMLTRKLRRAQEMQKIQGIRLARTCPILTHFIYADDLIVLGNADATDVQELGRILAEFGKVSGLTINPVKSKLWLSRRCDIQARQLVHNKFRADEAGSEERYLGALLTNSNSAKKAGTMLLEKLSAKLTGWKSNMLTHVGRLVLIKSVLMSIPVYYMSVEILPKGLIKKMESLIAKFFWGKTDQVRYMSFVSWDRICQPIEKGGLGVRKLKNFGEALFLKLVWGMISDDEKLWVQVCKSKYYSNLGFWRARNVAGTSPLWRQTVRMRDYFKENVKWQVGDGEKIHALSQPWFQGWQVASQATRDERRVKVASLFDYELNQWKIEEMTRLLGHEATTVVTQTVQKPCRIPGLGDKLIWNCTAAGKYTVKEGYDQTMIRMNPQREDVPWYFIWKWKKIAPKVRMFMWRLLTNGLPLAQNMHRRIHSISPRCTRCQLEDEYPAHCFFFCHASRLVWFGGNLGIRTDELPIDIKEAVKYITNGMNDDSICEFCYTLWEIWLARNEFIFQQKNFEPIGVCRKVQTWLRNREDLGRENEHYQMAKEIVPYEFLPGGWQIVIDASWDATHKAGTAFLVYYEGALTWLEMDNHEAADSFQAEAMALQNAVDWIQGTVQAVGSQRCKIFSDCINLVSAVQERNLENLPSWRSRPIIANIISQLHQLDRWIFVQHVTREAVKPAHEMANKARRMSIAYRGIPMASIMQEHSMGMEIDSRFFQQVQENPP
ncbi:RNA-directed DNA polymerase (reverse transcriptase)-related family protein [Rhynchospora pubera]|uniref:RNA-directed DNA polymerase (Reverse transcriptase)-related family protein n=1 Tax=Rhynchospora pubera TaxID=906938 RepID=A0AAV8ECZ2_9POAL|nr:RNA-directed DNA polymerase (reverse transcriptase)-related family protein [Rhynchospora pubera]